MNAEELKELSEDKILKLNLKPNKNMPINFELSELKFKSAEEIGKRILVLIILIGVLYNQKRSKLKKLIEQHNLNSSLSKNEKDILNKWFLTKQDKINIGWYSESIEVLGWSIGLWDKIEYIDVCDEYRQAENTPDINKSTISFFEKIKLIDKNRIYEEFDFIYRMHGIAKKQNIGKLDNNTESTYREKHKAIIWLAGIEEDWDNINTDT